MKKGQLGAVIKPDELKADTAYYTHNVEGLSSQVRESEAALRYQERQTVDQIRQAESTLASTEAQVAAATADFRERAAAVHAHAGPGEERHRRAAGARPDTHVAGGRTGEGRRAQAAGRGAARHRGAGAIDRESRPRCGAARCRPTSACRRPRPRSGRRPTCAWATPRSVRPSTAIVDVLAARVGEVVSPGQPIVTLINPDDLWVRVDVEETYIDRLRIGDKLTVRLPSGDEREGTVFYRGMDAGFATQRDVSRTKARHQDVRDPLARRQPGSPPRGRHDRVRAAWVG